MKKYNIFLNEEYFDNMKNKYIVIATKEQLESVGCDRDLTGKEVDYVGEYSSGYVRIRVEARESVKQMLGIRAQKEEYDIPKKWFKIVKK